VERVPPMSLHLGLVRIGSGSSPLWDVLYDTTDSDRNHPAFAFLPYTREAGLIASALPGSPIGIKVDAF